MAKTKQEKKNLIESYTENLNGSKAFFIITPTEITPNEVNELRKKLHRENSTFVFVKNTLFKKALQNIEKKDIDNLDLRNQKPRLSAQYAPDQTLR